jgi:hypothetical protein
MVLCPLWPSPPSTALCSTSTALYSLYDPLFPQQPSLQPLSPLWPSVSSKALCPLYVCSLSALLSSVSSAALFPSMTIYPLWGPLSSLRPSVSSKALCPLYGALFPLRPSVPSEKQRNKRNDPLVLQNVLHNAFCQNSKGYHNLFRISVPDRSRNIPEVVLVRRWAVGVLGIWRGEGLGEG